MCCQVAAVHILCLVDKSTELDHASAIFLLMGLNIRFKQMAVPSTICCERGNCKLFSFRDAKQEGANFSGSATVHLEKKLTQITSSVTIIMNESTSKRQLQQLQQQQQSRRIPSALNHEDGESINLHLSNNSGTPPRRSLHSLHDYGSDGDYARASLVNPLNGDYRMEGAQGMQSNKVDASFPASAAPARMIDGLSTSSLNLSDGSGNSRNVVTAATTASASNTTSSGGDDPDSNAGGRGRLEQMINSNHHNHHHRSRRRRVLANDGSTLQVPEDDGSEEGPAAVVAARFLLHHQNSSDTTTNVSSSGGSGGEGKNLQETLLGPRREPGYHTLRKTFSKLPRRGNKSKSAAAMHESCDHHDTLKKIRIQMDPITSSSSIKGRKMSNVLYLSRSRPSTIHAGRSRDSPTPSDSMDDSTAAGGGSSSGSGTEDGYAGSASSNENSGQQDSFSHSASSSDECRGHNNNSFRRHHHHRSKNAKSARTGGGGSGNSSSSSEIADFSSGASILNEDHQNTGGFSIDSTPSSSPSPSSSNEDERLNNLEQVYWKAKASAVVEDQATLLQHNGRKRKAPHASIWSRKPVRTQWLRPTIRFDETKKACRETDTPILTLGSDIMAHVLTFLQPPEILDVLTAPLSRCWRQAFTLQPELWQVLCLLEPFKAKIHKEPESDKNSSSEDSFVSLKFEQESRDKRLLDRYRQLYTSFVRCMKYLSQIKEDALNGRQPSFIDYGFVGRSNRSRSDSPPILVGTNTNFQAFQASVRNVQETNSGSNTSSENDEYKNSLLVRPKKRSRSAKRKDKKPNFGTSMITNRLFGPSQTGEPGQMNLPWSCAIYSIVNWMVAFLDVEGIQILCMDVLPYLLEDEEQRLTAQRSGLTDIVLRGMVLFNDSVQLHIAAFHAIVLLARPLGGREGMLFHSSMVASGIFGGPNSQHRKNGIAVMLDSMRRFEDNEVLQAMSCWALVNVALSPAQKVVLVKLGGIQATANAMLRHPFNAEVQFRALFALINLVIPCKYWSRPFLLALPSFESNANMIEFYDRAAVRMNSDSPEALAIQEQLGDVNDTSEKEIIDELVGEIADLVVTAMKNFCSSEAILNRACLVLHNLSLTQEYHRTLLWTPNCYQMLEWCLANYRTDQVLQQSASGTLHRLQVTLSNDTDLRNRFSQSLHLQQQTSLEQAHREAVRLHEQQDELLRITEH